MSFQRLYAQLEKDSWWVELIFQWAFQPQVSLTPNFQMALQAYELSFDTTNRLKITLEVMRAHLCSVEWVWLEYLKLTDYRCRWKVWFGSDAVLRLRRQRSSNNPSTHNNYLLFTCSRWVGMWSNQFHDLEVEGDFRECVPAVHWSFDKSLELSLDLMESCQWCRMLSCGSSLYNLTPPMESIFQTFSRIQSHEWKVQSSIVFHNYPWTVSALQIIR